MSMYDQFTEEIITEVETAIDHALYHESRGDDDHTGRLPLIFERLHGVQNAIDDWRQG